jgi:DNA repair exonuclease SbcCD ATPase subunit
MTKTPGKTAGDRTTADDTPATAREAGTEMLGGGNLDQVREILFGAQSRGMDKRLARLEEELPKRVAEIREELKRGIANLETYARKEIDSLNERLNAESKERGKDDEELGAKLDEAARGLRKEVAQLGERSTAAQRELRQQILDQAKRLDDEIQRRTDDLTSALARAVEELRSEKADRKAVAGILHEVAMRLTDELTLPLGDGAKS